MTRKRDSDQLPEKEIERRMKEMLRAALNVPPRSKQTKAKHKKRKASG
jgi:hypothetical protein